MEMKIMDNVIKFKKQTAKEDKPDIVKMILEEDLLNLRRSIQFLRPDSIDDSIEQLEGKYFVERNILENILALTGAGEEVLDLLTDLDEHVTKLHHENGGDLASIVVTGTRVFHTDLFEFSLSIVQFGFGRFIRKIDYKRIPLKHEDGEISFGRIMERAKALREYRIKVIGKAIAKIKKD